jgi:EAL domain-containing protein (putative c-di-GMP-specific phosphodiesterase class I)/GGDEF domain-containing protein
VLVVDADTARRLASVALLRELGARVADVPDPATARLHCERLEPDLVLRAWPLEGDLSAVDLVWPNRDGEPLPCGVIVPAGEVESGAQAAAIGALGVLEAPLARAALSAFVRAAARIRSLELQLSGERALLQRIETGAGVGVFEFDARTSSFRLSKGAARLFGLADAPHTAAASALYELTETADRQRFYSWVEALCAGRTVAPLEIQLAAPGHVHRILRLGASSPSTGWLQALPERVTPMPDSSDRCVYDAATGLPERAQFAELVNQRSTRAALRHAKIALLCLELHSADSDGAVPEGLMVAVARRVRNCLRDQDILAHMPVRGRGDVGLGRIESTMLGVELELEHSYDAASVARRLLELLSEPYVFGGETHRLEVHIGIAVFPDDAQDAEAMIALAEEAVRHGRARGEARIEYWSPTLNASSFQRLALERDLRKALEHDQICLYYQPKIEIATGRVSGFEALMRWKHPEHGLVSPAQFIPLAEETGLIVPLGRWAIEEASRQVRAWADAGKRVRVAVNVSLAQFQEPDLYDTIVQALERSGADPRLFEIELTESLLMDDKDAAIAVLRRLKQHGLHISIDDFGTGYSSLAYLKRFPIDALKIDQSFVRGISTNPDDAAIATSIILMGRSLKLNVIAEGVETKSQLAFLRVMQCNEAQGYFYSPPLPAAEATAYLDRAAGDKAAA